MASRELFPTGKLLLTLQRLAFEVIEHYPRLSDVCFVAIQPRGILLGRRMMVLLKEMVGNDAVKYGELDVTFFRDDFRRTSQPVVPSVTKVDFLIENQNVILMDDVLYTGRTIRAAMDAMLAFGRPNKVELMILIDRLRKRDLPIQANYVGVAVETLDNEKVIVQWQEKHGADSVTIQTKEAQ